MQNLRYVGNNLFVEKLSIKNILKKNKTPFYIYSESQIAFNFLKFANTFKKTDPLVCFAAKSNSNLNIYAFEYIDKIFGKGVFQGVMSDEVPTNAVSKGEDGYDRVDYSKLDVEFKNI